MKKTLASASAICASLFAATSILAQNMPTAPTMPTAQSNKPVATNSAPAKKSNIKANQVWVNGKVYHCPGTHYYGNTKRGEYMTEQAAIAAGATASRNKPCSR